MAPIPHAIASMDLAWAKLDRIVVAACIGERSLDDAIASMCRTVDETWDTTCSFELGVTAGPRAASPADDDIVRFIGAHDDETQGVLRLLARPSLDATAVDRLERLFRLLVERTLGMAPLPKLHRLKNRLAGILTNLELVELLVADAPGRLASGETDTRQHAQLLAALRFAQASGRDMADLLRAAGEPESKA